MQGAARPQIDPKQMRKSLITWGLVIAGVIVVTQVGWSNIWREGLIRPSLNTLLFLYAHVGQSFVVAIGIFTLALRVLTMPLQIRQIRSSRRMQAVQPKLAEIQKKYKGNQEKLVQEQQKLYKEAGVNPLGGCLPTLVQFPIWISLYQSINSILADTPLELMHLGKTVYPAFTEIVDILPLQSHFLWLNLAKPDPTPFVLPVLVAGTMWLQQRMMTKTTGATGDDQAAQMNQTMQVMMPLMFGWFTTQFASGLAIYFVISNVIGVILQWAIERIEGPVTLDGDDSNTPAKKERAKNAKPIK